MIILAIESSCDDSAVAVLKDGHNVLSSLVSSQVETHARFGGVVPEIAAREHLAVMSSLAEEAVAKAGITWQDIDLIAVTQGPGLIGSLLIGVTFAKGLSINLGIPLLPVDHVHAHVHGALLSIKETGSQAQFPCLALVASGGHCNLYYMKSAVEFELIGITMDDACGECFDKVAKKLGFGYPGGPVIEKLARQGDANAYAMPRMIEEKDRLVFSYSGLKTHMVNLIHKLNGKLDDKVIADLCACFQKEALGQLVRKIEIAANLKPDIDSVVIAGGVAANGFFKTAMESTLKVPVHFPSLKYCSDNAAMIAAYAYELQASHKNFPLLDEWDAYSRYNFRRYMQS